MKPLLFALCVVFACGGLSALQLFVSAKESDLRFEWSPGGIYPHRRFRSCRDLVGSQASSLLERETKKAKLSIDNFA